MDFLSGLSSVEVAADAVLALLDIEDLRRLALALAPTEQQQQQQQPVRHPLERYLVKYLSRRPALGAAYQVHDFDGGIFHSSKTCQRRFFNDLTQWLYGKVVSHPLTTVKVSEDFPTVTAEEDGTIFVQVPINCVHAAFFNVHCSIFSKRAFKTEGSASRCSTPAPEKSTSGG